MCQHGHELTDENVYIFHIGRNGAPRRVCKVCHKARIARQHADGTHKRQVRAGTVTHPFARIGQRDGIPYLALAYGAR